MRYFVLILPLLFMLNGCSSLQAVIAMSRSTDNFQTLNQNLHVKYEKGAKEYAQKISQYVEPAIQTIENRQGTFKKDVIIFVTSSIEGFSSYCASNKPSACVIGERLFISPKLMQHPKRIPTVLTHELSHLQFTQDIGFWNYQLKLPVWFKEGLAVYVSNGSGAENVTKQEALQAIKLGKAMQPNDSGTLLFTKTAYSFDLKPHMFYRQSEMYVAWLHDTDPSKFQKLFTLLEKGKTLNEALMATYSFSVSQGWDRFTHAILSEDNNA